VLGLSAFASCASPYLYFADFAEKGLRGKVYFTAESYATMRTQLETTALEPRTHGGGGGSWPFYVVYFTEHEVLNFIRASLEEAGLNFSENLPKHTVNFGLFNFGLILYDEEKNAAVSHVYMPFSNGSRFAEHISDEFAQQEHDISVGVFYAPDVTVGWPWWYFEEEREAGDNYLPTPEDIEEARQMMIENLTEQVQNFIERLQREGVL
jgi:hypothetical protein